jgi:hypothetical protein
METTEKTKKCPFCGEEILAAAKKCKHCGKWLEQIPQETEYVQPEYILKQSNNAGTAGFVFALLALLFFWVPVFGWILCILGLIFSLAGVFNSPRGLDISGLMLSGIRCIIRIRAAQGLAVTGLIISALDLYLLLTVFEAVWAALSAALPALHAIFGY